jgi:hypothetical protein
MVMVFLWNSVGITGLRWKVNVYAGQSRFEKLCEMFLFLIVVDMQSEEIRTQSLSVILRSLVSHV